MFLYRNKSYRLIHPIIQQEVIYLGRRNNKGKNKELTDFSYLLNKEQEKDANNRIKKDNEKEN